ncbi:hypothetical protein C8J57DRAFT_1125134 [Mycena rebaudengoi]|nr:hypothetical protein C8J57DRAFT_1125134 [Mycena rebaudengoi]
MTPQTREDQYQHFIPRFILRRFQPGGIRKSRVERQREYARTRSDSESILVYELETQSLTLCPVGSVYGVRNLYQDVRSSLNINELEEKLSKLEGDAAKIVNDLHTALAEKRDFGLKRRALDRLRKFLFLMHYRNSTLSKTYFQEDHPQSRAARDWTEQYRLRHHLDSATDMWLHCLRYFLDTSHAQIALDASQMYEKFGLLAMTSGGPIPPEAEYYHAVAYQLQAGHYFLCVWEAADGEEFILGSNGFGLWEGVGPGTAVHRIFVISPRLTLVLRSGFLRDEVNQGHHIPTNSDLIDIKHTIPVATYQDGSHGLSIDPDALNSYRATSPAENDLFTFKITKLTSSQTLALNSVILLNVPPTGSITFTSKSSILRTCRLFQRSISGRIHAPNKFSPLIRCLSPSTRVVAATPAQPRIGLSLFEILLGIVTKDLEFRSDYDRAKAILVPLNASTSEFAEEHQHILSGVIQKYGTVLQSLPAFPISPSILTDSLPRTTSDCLFATLSAKLGFGAQTNILEKIQNQVVCIAFLEWVLNHGRSIRHLVEEDVRDMLLLSKSNK